MVTIKNSITRNKDKLKRKIYKERMFDLYYIFDIYLFRIIVKEIYIWDLDYYYYYYFFFIVVNNNYF